MTIPLRENELAAYIEKQPYVISQDGITLTIAKNVFPSDFGLTSSFVGRFILQQAPAVNALDMGCGSGYFAFLLKKIGCRSVVGVDFNRDAVQCAMQNCSHNPELAPITFIHSDLFESVPSNQFGIIVFNFNYYPSHGLYGLNEDGGRQILERFFTQVVNYMNSDTRIYIPYSEFVGVEHDPQYIAPSYGFTVETVTQTQNQAGNHVVYRVTRTFDPEN